MADFGWDLPPGVTQAEIDAATGEEDWEAYDVEPEPSSLTWSQAIALALLWSSLAAACVLGALRWREL